MSRFEVRFVDSKSGRFISRMVEAEGFHDAIGIALKDILSLHLCAEGGPPPEADMIRRVR